MDQFKILALTCISLLHFLYNQIKHKAIKIKKPSYFLEVTCVLSAQGNVQQCGVKKPKNVEFQKITMTESCLMVSTRKPIKSFLKILLSSAPNRGPKGTRFQVTAFDELQWHSVQQSYAINICHRLPVSINHLY